MEESGGEVEDFSTRFGEIQKIISNLKKGDTID